MAGGAGWGCAGRGRPYAAGVAAAVVFDMDGVLLDSEPLWQRAEIEVFGSVGLHLDDAACRRTMGMRIDEVVAFWFARAPWRGPSPAAVTDALLSRVCRLITDEAEPLPGVDTVLAELARREVPVGLATSSPGRVIEAVFDRLGLHGRFAAVCSAEHEAYGKPHPAVYLQAAAELGVAPTSCVAIEDSVNGVISAKAARMGCIAVPAPELRSDPRFVVADAVVTDLGSALEVLTVLLGTATG